MAKIEIRTDGAPHAMGGYSQGIKAGKLIFTAGQVGIDPATGELAGPTIGEQTARALDNIAAVLGEAGATARSSVAVNLVGFLVEIEAIAVLPD